MRLITTSDTSGIDDYFRTLFRVQKDSNVIPAPGVLRRAKLFNAFGVCNSETRSFSRFACWQLFRGAAIQQQFVVADGAIVSIERGKGI